MRAGRQAPLPPTCMGWAQPPLPPCGMWGGGCSNPVGRTQQIDNSVAWGGGREIVTQPIGVGGEGGRRLAVRTHICSRAQRFRLPPRYVAPEI